MQSPAKFVPLREAPDAADDNDGQRLRYVSSWWSDQDDLWRHFNRQVEENVRMVAGQQYIIWHPILNKYLDVSEWMSEDEQRWRQRPVFNRLLPYFIITHARATENSPIITFVPGPDEIDAQLAETMDVLFKTKWADTGMEDVHDRVMAWMILAGRAHLQTRLDMSGGAIEKWIGRAETLPILDQYGEPIMRGDGQGPQLVPGNFDDIPHGPDGEPLAHITEDGQLQITGEAHQERKPKMIVDVLSPLQVRGTWGPTPWHQKRRHGTKYFLSPEEVYTQYGIEVEPDMRGGSVNDIGELERVLFGTGFYGSANSYIDAQAANFSTDGYCEVTAIMEAPCDYGGLEETEESAGGRYTVTTKKTVLYDGVRPAKFKYTSPIRTFEFVRLPGRPGGTTPIEHMNPIQRSYNLGFARIGEHVSLSTNPKGVIDSASGMKSKQFTNAPGENYILNRRPGIPAIEYVVPPPLGTDVYKYQGMLGAEFNAVGNLSAQEGDLPQNDASGEMLKEWRFDRDRFIGPTMRRASIEYARMAEDWKVLIPLTMSDQEIISYSGDDNIARTIVVMPYMFTEGNVDVRPDVESMMPEGRGERQQRVYAFYKDGLFGVPGTPQATMKFWEMAHFPHLSRAGKFGGVDRTMADQENGKLLQGAPAQVIPVYPWYDDDVHLMVLETFMKSPEFLKQANEIKNNFVLHWQAHKASQMRKMMMAAQQQSNMALLTNPTPGAPAGGKPSGKAEPGDTSVRPDQPTAPTDGTPEGKMPTALASASA